MSEPERPQPSPDELPGFGGAFGRWLVHASLGMGAIVAGYVIFRDGAGVSDGMIVFVVVLTIVVALVGALVRPRGPGPWS